MSSSTYGIASILDRTIGKASKPDALLRIVRIGNHDMVVIRRALRNSPCTNSP